MMPAVVPGRSLTACIRVVVAILAVGVFRVAPAVVDLEGEPTFDEVSSVGSLPLRTRELPSLPLAPALAGFSLEWCLVGRVAPSSSQGHTLSSASFDEYVVQIFLQILVILEYNHTCCLF